LFLAVVALLVTWVVETVAAVALFTVGIRKARREEMAEELELKAEEKTAEKTEDVAAASPSLAEGAPAHEGQS
jgi:hypothetical protein